MSDDVTGIDTTLAEYVAAVNAGDVKAYGTTLAHDAVFMPPDSPKLTGKEDILAWVKRDFFDPYHVRFQMKFDDVQVVGSQALAPGAFTLGLTPRAGGATMSRAGKCMNVFRKQADGSWKLAHAIFNFDKALA
jgi:uncharacterized protein (TIGR02246 family)